MAGGASAAEKASVRIHHSAQWPPCHLHSLTLTPKIESRAGSCNGAKRLGLQPRREPISLRPTGEGKGGKGPSQAGGCFGCLSNLRSASQKTLPAVHTSDIAHLACNPENIPAMTRPLGRHRAKGTAKGRRATKQHRCKGCPDKRHLSGGWGVAQGGALATVLQCPSCPRQHPPSPPAPGRWI